MFVTSQWRNSVVWLNVNVPRHVSLVPLGNMGTFSDTSENVHIAGMNGSN